MAGHGGGAWKVAYADFVTAMMAFFLVMWITAQDKAVKDAVAHYFENPYQTALKPGGDACGSSLMPANKPGTPPGPSLLPSSKPGHAGGGNPATVSRSTGRGGAEPPPSPDADRKVVAAQRPSLFALHDGSERNVGTLVVFAEESAELDDKAQGLLKELAPELLGMPHKIEIRGHSPRRAALPQRTAEDAWGLSYARCFAVMEFLERQGVEPQRFRLSQGGPFEPYTVRDDLAKHVYNSRVEVYMLNEIAEDFLGTPQERAGRFVPHWSESQKIPPRADG